jgi:hypothetical protein
MIIEMEKLHHWTNVKQTTASFDENALSVVGTLL